MRDQGQDLRHRGQDQGLNLQGQGQGLIDLRSQGQKHTFEADIFTSYMYTQCICRTLYMQVDPQLSTVLTKAKKANIMSSFKVNASLPESQGQDLGGQGQGLRGQGQGLDLRGQGRGLDFRGQGQGQGHANLASRRLEAKAVASRTTSLITEGRPE